MLGLTTIAPKTKSNNKLLGTGGPLNKKLPKSVDWRENKNPVLVGPVQNQEKCGSCWTFSAVAAIEAAHAKNTDEFVKLSEQNLVDCARGPRYISEGCQGGEMREAFDYVIRNKGIDKLDAYLYEAKNGECRYNDSTSAVGATLSSYAEIPAGNEKALAEAVAQRPVSIAIDASSIFFQLYSSGVYDDIFCAASSLNHGVLAVGYGPGYWIVRNSWGPDWGDEGYIKMKRGKNLCGIAEDASYPIV